LIKKQQNSTEQLLKTIRQSSDTEKDTPPSTQTFSPLSYIKKTDKKSLTLGVYLGHDALFLVLSGPTNGLSKGPFKWSKVPYPDDIPFENERFPSFLKSAISRFTDKTGNMKIWTAINPANLKLKNIKIPDVRESKAGNAAFWSFKKETGLDPEQEIFNFETIEHTTESGIKKQNLVAFSGDKKEINNLKRIFARAGFPLTGITALPLALQNFIRNGIVNASPHPLCIINIDRFHCEITCFSDKSIYLNRNTKTGSYSLVEDILSETETMEKGKEDPVEILSDIHTNDSENFSKIENAAERLIGKISRTSDYCSQQFASNEPVARYLFFGETDGCPAFNDYAASRLPADTQKLEPFADGTTGRFAAELPKEAKERSGFIPALALSLSSNDITPGFLYTYHHKIQRKKYKRVNLLITLIFLVVMTFSSGAWLWQKSLTMERKQNQKQIEQQLKNFSPKLSRQMVSSLIGQASEKFEQIERYENRIFSLAILNEIFSKTPETISLFSLNAGFAGDTENTGNTGTSSSSRQQRVTLRGVVDKTDKDPDSILTGYVISLGNSPLLGDILIDKKTRVKTENKVVVKFTARMEILK